MTSQSTRPWSRAALGVFLVAQIVASSASIAQNAPSETKDTYFIGVGDVLTVSVWKNEDLTVTVPVRPDGRISLPLVGEVEVVGRTPESVRTILNASYQDFVTSPAVSVVIQEINSRKIFIMGEVGTPGVYDLVQPTRLLQALALAGGVTDFAKEDQVVVLREEGGIERRTVVSIKDIQTGKRLDANMRLQPGDTIIVP
jgi:polysaccharide export outer membrane protein